MVIIQMLHSISLFCKFLSWNYASFCSQSGGNAYNCYKIDKTNGALIVVRPDGFIAQVAAVSAAGAKEIDSYFTKILIRQN